MGYRCPVCADPQADDVHLANHLAFTALARGGDHERWLDEHVPGWESMGESDLAAQVVEPAESTAYPGSFETESTGGHTHDHGHEHLPESPGSGESHRADDDSTGHRPFGGELDEEARAAIERARELTRQRRASGDSDGDEDEP